MRISDWSSDVCSSDLQLWAPGLDRGLSTEEGATLNINGADVPYYLARDAVFSPDVRGSRTRPSVNAALQWAPTSSSVYTAEFFRSEERRVGKECVSSCISRCSPYHYTKYHIISLFHLSTSNQHLSTPPPPY